MGIIEKTKLGVGSFLLKKKIKQVVRERSVHNLKTARTIGIIFDATHLDSYETANKLITFFRDLKLQTNAIGYVDTKEIIDFYTARKGYDFFCKKNLKWTGTPKNPGVSTFIDKSFDILVDLSMEEHLPIQYIVGLSKARFKVGRFISETSQYDFMIDIRKNNDLNYFIDQIKHYLTVINNT